MLGGQFDYEEDNQRALPFNVRITEISEEMKVHRGSTSKWTFINDVTQEGVKGLSICDPIYEGPSNTVISV